MKCEELEPLVSGYVDGELPPDQRAQVEAHLAACESCRRELAAVEALKENLAMVKFKEPQDAKLERYWKGIYNRLERGVGWVLLSLGAIIVLCYGGFKLVEGVVTAPGLAAVLKIGVVALVFGVVILFVSLLRERLTVRKVDRYSREVER